MYNNKAHLENKFSVHSRSYRTHGCCKSGCLYHVAACAVNTWKGSAASTSKLCGLRVGEGDVFYMLWGWACRWVGDFFQTWSFSSDLGSCLKTKTRSWKHIVHPAQRRIAGFIYLFIFFFSSNHAYAYLDAEITFSLWSFSAVWPCPFNFWLQRTPAYVTKLLTQSM